MGPGRHTHTVYSGRVVVAFTPTRDIEVDRCRLLVAPAAASATAAATAAPAAVGPAAAPNAPSRVLLRYIAMALEVGPPDRYCSPSQRMAFNSGI